MPARYVHSAPVHLNGNLFCAVDVETTGLDAQKNSIIELCVLPLNSDYTQNKTILPFDIQMQPIQGRIIDPEAMQINKLDLAHIMVHALDAYKVADLLVEWFESLNLGQFKRIIPIAQNWPFDRSFIHDWLGAKTFEMIFHREFRDTFPVAGFLNDRNDMHNRQIEHPKLNLKYLCSIYKVENPAPHRALGDCVATAEVYRKMLQQSM